MINVESKKPKGFNRELKIESDEKVTIKFLETASGDIVAFVYKGVGDEIEDWHEPVAMYSSRSKNNKWSVK